MYYAIKFRKFFPSLFYLHSLSLSLSLRLNLKWSLLKFQDNVREKPVSMAMVASRWITLSYYCTIKIQDESPNCVHGNLADVFYLGNRILVLQVETGLIPHQKYSAMSEPLSGLTFLQHKICAMSHLADNQYLLNSAWIPSLNMSKIKWILYWM